MIADNVTTWPRDAEGAVELASVAAAHRPDAVVSLGDMYAHHVEVAADLGVNLFGVYGNHCRPGYLGQIPGTVDLIGDPSLPARRGVLTLPGQRPVSLLAVQGCVRYKDEEDVLFEQHEYAAVLDRIPAADLVITHCPPRGVNDAEDAAHVGIDALRTWVDRHSPRWLLHGHTYRNPARSMHGSTEVFYVSGHAVIDLDLSAL